MKFSKKELKAVIKECLIELLAEGLGGNLNEAVEQPIRRPTSLPKPVARQPLPMRPTPTSALKEAVKREAGNNPVLADILADTAMTTLQSQINAEGRGPIQAADAASMTVAQSTPEELFGDEASSKWADLAFNTPAPPRSS